MEENQMASEQKKIAWISWLRVCAMTMIVLCHIAVQSGSALGNIAGQFLNVGVEIFFLLSGYLFGRKNIQTGYGEWLWKRMTRIVPAYYLFLVILAGVHLTLGIHQKLENWLISVLFLEGIEVYLLGAEHLWFLTVMLACYFITPVMDILKKKNMTSSKYLWFFLGISAILQVLATVFVSTQLGRYWNLVNLYILAYILGSCQFICKSPKMFVTAVSAGIAAIAFRLIGRFCWDGTVFYTLYIVGLTHAVLALSIMMVFQFCIHKTPGKLITFFDNISYEVYLVHYMLICGPISLMHMTDSFFVSAVAACILTVVSATMLHEAINFLTKTIRR